jgi:hypothetical protein
MQVGKLNPVGSAKVNFPGFQEILDFTSAGSEASKSVTVIDDLEYHVDILNLSTTQPINITLNTGFSYGQQYLQDVSSTISAARSTASTIMVCAALSFVSGKIISPASFPKTSIQQSSTYSSGTNVLTYKMDGMTATSTASTTSIVATPASGNFASGSRVVITARRSNT